MKIEWINIFLTMIVLKKLELELELELANMGVWLLKWGEVQTYKD